VVDADQSQCDVSNYVGLTIKQMFRPQYHDFQRVPLFARIIDRLIMGQTGTPRAPLFIGNGLSDSIGDGVMVTEDVQELAYIYCHRGVPVNLEIYDGLNHTSAGLPFFEAAELFLTQRFADQSIQSGCSSIVPGASIAPVRAPSA